MPRGREGLDGNTIESVVRALAAGNIHEAQRILAEADKGATEDE